MAVMKWKDAQKLIRLGFREKENGDYWRPFSAGGNVKTILLVRDTVVGYEYRAAVANSSQKKGQEQWFDAQDIAEAIFLLLEARRVWKKARRALEGGLARRTLRRIWG